MTVALGPDDLMRRYWVDWVNITFDVEVFEKVAAGACRRWGWLPTGSSLLTSLFGAGSGIAGWALWSTPAGKTVWLVVAGATTVVSIIAAGLGFSNKAKSYSEAFGKLNALRRRLYSFQASSIRRSVAIDSGMQDKLDAFRKEWDEMPPLDYDLFNTKHFQGKVQREVEQSYRSKNWLT